MKKLITMLLFVALFSLNWLAAAAQDKPEANRPKLHVTAHVVDDIGISAQDIVAGAKKFFGKRHVEVVDESGEGVKELFVTVGKDDADDDNDNVEDAKDTDDDGDNIEDSKEQIEVFDLYDRLPCDMITSFPDQKKEEGVYVIISGADRAESIRFNSIVDTFAGGADEMADDEVFQYHLFHPAIEQGFVEIPKARSAMLNHSSSYFQTVSFSSARNFVQSSGPVMTFPQTTIDYGTIEKGSDKIRKFLFTNTGNEPLIIKSAKGSCGCTVPTYPQEPIMPGESANIDVSYDTNRPGNFNKTVTLTTNETESTHTLTIKGEVRVPPTQESVPQSTGGLAPAGDRSPAAPAAPAAPDCKTLTDPLKARDCWVNKAKAGEKNLSGVSFSAADLTNANLSGANLTNANLIGANLTGANLSNAILTGAKVNAATKGVDLNAWKARGGIVVP